MNDNDKCHGFKNKNKKTDLNSTEIGFSGYRVPKQYIIFKYSRLFTPYSKITNFPACIV